MALRMTWDCNRPAIDLRRGFSRIFQSLKELGRLTVSEVAFIMNETSGF